MKLVDLDTIEVLDESFRQHIFAEFLKDNFDKPSYKDLRKKVREFIPKVNYKDIKGTGRVPLDPTNYESVNKTIGQYLVEVDYNKTQTIKVVVPGSIRSALFDGWEDKGMNLIKSSLPLL